MTRSYKDIMADRSARLPPDSAAQRETFEKATTSRCRSSRFVKATA